jgi:hypothetical protein
MVDGNLPVVDELYDPGLGQGVEVRAEQQLYILLFVVASRPTVKLLSVSV